MILSIRSEFLAVSLVAFAAACDDGPSSAAFVPREARLAVADGVDGRVAFVDLRDGDVVGTVALTGPSTLYAERGRRFVVAVNRPAGLVNLIDSGIAYVDHGDHGHTTYFEPTVNSFAMPGTAPAHVTFHEGRTAVFFDGAVATATSAENPARVVVFSESSLWRGTPDPVDVPLEAAHHGVAVALPDGTLVSADAMAAPGATSNPLPDGLAFVDDDGVPLASFDASCPALHGKAVLGADRIAFGCATHVVILERAAGAPFSSRTLAYPDSRRTGSLVADEATQALFANYSNDTTFAMLRIDATTGAHLEVGFDAAIASFDLVDLHGEAHLVVMTKDGMLHVLEGGTLELLGSIPVTSTFASSGPTPKIAFTQETVYVSSPGTGEVVEVDVEARAVRRRFVFEGAPTSIVVLGPGTAVDGGSHEHEH